MPLPGDFFAKSNIGKPTLNTKDLQLKTFFTGDTQFADAKPTETSDRLPKS
jgi:hypothetical protein